LQPDSKAHIIEGWRHLDSSKISSVYDPTSLDDILTISNNETIRMMVRAAKEEGLLLSPSSAANLAGALKVADTLEQGTIVTVLPDDVRKYESLNLQAE